MTSLKNYERLKPYIDLVGQNWPDDTVIKCSNLQTSTLVSRLRAAIAYAVKMGYFVTIPRKELEVVTKEANVVIIRKRSSEPAPIEPSNLRKYIVIQSPSKQELGFLAYLSAKKALAAPIHFSYADNPEDITQFYDCIIRPSEEPNHYILL